MLVSTLAEERDRGRVGYLILNDVMESLIRSLELPLVFFAALVSRGHGVDSRVTPPRIPGYLPVSARREPQGRVEQARRRRPESAAQSLHSPLRRTHRESQRSRRPCSRLHRQPGYAATLASSK